MSEEQAIIKNPTKQRLVTNEDECFVTQEHVTKKPGPYLGAGKASQRQWHLRSKG